jgi:hypothetical protein
VPLAAELTHLKKLDAGKHKYLLVLPDFIFNPLLKVEILPAQKKNPSNAFLPWVPILVQLAVPFNYNGQKSFKRFEARGQGNSPFI